MAEIKPRVDFYTIELTYRKKEFKTFTDFVCEVGNKKYTYSQSQYLRFMLDLFMFGLHSNMANDEQIHKQVGWLNKSANRYRAYCPRVDEKMPMIYGVISGGRYGRHGMITEKVENEDDTSTSAIQPSKAIHRYAYFCLYTPLGSKRGCLVIHSNSRDESIADALLSFIRKFFAQGNFCHPKVNHFCPKYLQEKFRKNSFLKQVNLSTSYIDGNIDTIGTTDELSEYDVRILITPKDKDKGRLGVSAVRKIIQKFSLLHNKDKKEFENFESRKVTIEDRDTKAVQSFEFDMDDIDLCPRIDVGNILNSEEFQEDGTPQFDSLHTAIKQILVEQVIPELELQV